MLLEGIVGIAVGVLTALALLYLIAAWTIVTGIFEIVEAVRLRREIKGEWLLVLGGIAALVFGVILVILPGAGALAVIWLIGAYSILFGIVLLGLAFRLQRKRAA